MIIQNYMTQTSGKLPKSPAKSQNANCFFAQTVCNKADNRANLITLSNIYGGIRK